MSITKNDHKRLLYHSGFVKDKMVTLSNHSLSRMFKKKIATRKKYCSGNNNLKNSSKMLGFFVESMAYLDRGRNI